MQDRLKFRVWHETLKQMHYNDFIITATGYTAKLYQENDYMMKFNQYDLEFDKQCVVMQSTGLKDKKGKLIYEGDLLKPLGEDDERVEVVWNEEKARFGLMIQWTDYCYWNGLYEETKTGRDYYELDDYYTDDFEVIGNIYENSELLEVENES